MDHIPVQKIADVITKARAGALNLTDFEEALETPLLVDISPWEFWALVGFVRHERRQKWVGYIVESRLRGSSRDLASAGPLGHPEDVEQLGDVPDTPGWKYFFHGRGCCLTNSDGTSIDVDFADDGSALEIDPYFFSNFLSSVPLPEWSDARLALRAPLQHAWQFEIAQLAEGALITAKWRFRVSSEGRRFVEQLEPIADEINRLAAGTSDTERLKVAWLLSALGDFVGAMEMARLLPADIHAVLSKAANIQVEKRIRLLQHEIATAVDSRRKQALSALAALGRKHVEKEVLKNLGQKPPTSGHFLSLDILNSWEDPSLEPVLTDALNRFTPHGGFLGFLTQKLRHEKDDVLRPRNGLLVAIARQLLRRHSSSTIPQETAAAIFKALRADRKACDAEAGFLLYLLSPKEGLKKIIANTRNPVPITREEAALFLVMIGTDQALDALIETAEKQPDRGGHEAACALSLSNAPRAKKAALAWVQRNDGYEDAEAEIIEVNGRQVKTWKMDDVMRSNMRQLVQGCADRLNRDYAALLTRWRRCP